MQLPTLIERSCIPNDSNPSDQHNIFSEKNEMALLGFTNLGLNKKEAWDFPEDLLCDYATQVSPVIVRDHVYINLSLPEKILAQYAAIKESTTGEAYTLKYYLLLLIFWGVNSPSHGEMCKSGILRMQMDQCHPMSLLYFKCISDFIYQ